MAVKTEKELSESVRALWLKVVAAIELRNFGYAISLLQEILKQEPEFLTGRQLLRRVEVTKTKSAKKSFFNISTAPIGVMKAQRAIKKDPKRAVEMLEDGHVGEADMDAENGIEPVQIHSPIGRAAHRIDTGDRGLALLRVTVDRRNGQIYCKAGYSSR